MAGRRNIDLKFAIREQNNYGVRESKWGLACVSRPPKEGMTPRISLDYRTLNLPCQS